MKLLQIAEYLEGAGLGTLGETIFIGQIPMECPNGILLRSPLQGTPIDYELPGYFRTEFQLVIRSNSYIGGETKAEETIAALTFGNKQVGNISFKYLRPKSLPVMFPLSKGNLLEFAVMMETAFTV